MCVKLPSENLNPDSHTSQTLIFANRVRWDAKDSIVKLLICTIQLQPKSSLMFFFLLKW